MKKILFVDDEIRLRQMYEKFFSSKGFEVVTAEDGCAAVNMVRNHEDIALIVMDLAMPNVNGELGIEVVRDIAPDVPIVIVSGHVPAQYQDEGIPGVCRIMHKPISMDALEKAIRSLIEQD
ncbi:MAG: response regulator [Planctomycetes bacterium]|nr:response regulator [Planctomycetota bacterium]